MFLVDSHCHLDLLDLTLDDGRLAPVIERAMAANVKCFLNVCVDVVDFPNVLQTAKAYPFVYASVGLHPHHEGVEPSVDELVQYASDDKVIALGETGLDYYRATGDLTWQRELFVRHILAAKIVKKPLIIHTREAKEDTLTILKKQSASDVQGVMHCFTEDWETAQKALDLDFYISISGIVTFKNAATVQEVAKKIPLDRLLVETDSPYLAPVPYRGKPNEPAYVKHTAEYIAALRCITFDELQAATTANFFTLFKGAMNPYV